MPVMSCYVAERYMLGARTRDVNPPRRREQVSAV